MVPDGAGHAGGGLEVPKHSGAPGVVVLGEIPSRDGAGEARGAGGASRGAGGAAGGAGDTGGEAGDVGVGADRAESAGRGRSSREGASGAEVGLRSIGGVGDGTGSGRLAGSHACNRSEIAIGAGLAGGEVGITVGARRATSESRRVGRSGGPKRYRCADG